MIQTTIKKQAICTNIYSCFFPIFAATYSLESVLYKLKQQGIQKANINKIMALPKVNIKNKKASYEYFLIEKFTAGIQLTGTEIKSIRYGKASIKEAHCAFKGDELFIRNMDISEYKLGTHYNHEPKRERKLLLTKRELRKLKEKVSEKGYTLVPILLFLSDKGLAKLNIALAKGKHTYDKRASLKDKDLKRDLDRSMQ